MYQFVTNHISICFFITSLQFGLGDHQIHENTLASHVQSIEVVDFTI